MGASRDELDKKVVLLATQKSAGMDVDKELKKMLREYKSEEDKFHIRNMCSILGLPLK
jgi:hypothetical protein